MFNVPFVLYWTLLIKLNVSKCLLYELLVYYDCFVHEGVQFINGLYLGHVTKYLTYVGLQ